MARSPSGRAPPSRCSTPTVSGRLDQIEVPILIGADGPKGTAVAEAVGDGIFAAAIPNAAAHGRHALLQFGTVLQDGEDLRSARVLEAAGHGVAVASTTNLRAKRSDRRRRVPRRRGRLEEVLALPAAERHLATHEGHLVHLTGRDHAALVAGIDMLPTMTLTGTADELLCPRRPTR